MIGPDFRIPSFRNGVTGRLNKNSFDCILIKENATKPMLTSQDRVHLLV